MPTTKRRAPSALDAWLAPLTDFYLRRLLLPGERLRLTSRPHPFMLVPRLLGSTVALVLLQPARDRLAALVEALLRSRALGELSPGLDLDVSGWLARAQGLLTAAILAYAVWSVLRWAFARYLVTDQRVLYLSGVLNRATLDSPLERIDDVLLVQSWLGQLLDYGDLTIVRTLAERGHTMSRLTRPLLFRQTLHSARGARLRSLTAEADKHPPAARPAGAASREQAATGITSPG